MSPWLALFVEEIRSRWLVLPTALAIGLLPVVMEWLPMGRRFTPGDLRDTSALALAILFSLGVALVVGSSMLSRELAEGRLGFYFVRPLTPSGLWWGKLGASVFLVAASWLGIWVPTLVAGGDPKRFLTPLESWFSVLQPAYPAEMPGRLSPPNEVWWKQFQSIYARMLDGAWPSWLLLALVMAACVTTSHYLATALRSRSPWLILDLFASGGLGLLVSAVAGRLFDQAAIPALSRGLVIGVLALPVAGALAGLAQQSWGRTVLRRAHGVFSCVFWGVLLLVTSLWAGWALRGERLAPTDFEVIHHLAFDPRGEWQIVAGSAGSTGHMPVLAVHRESGRWERLAALSRLDAWPVFAVESDLVVWSQCSRKRKEPCEILARDLDRPDEPRWVATTGRGVHLVLDRKGGRLATLEARNVAFYDLAKGRLLASHRLEDRLQARRGRFAPDGRFQALFTSFRRHERGERLLPDLEVWQGTDDGKTFEHSRTLPGYLFGAAPDWGRLAIWNRREVTVWDGWLENRLLEVGPFETRVRRVRFLSEGRIAVVQDGDQSLPPRVRILSPGGEVLHSFEHSLSTWYLGNEPSPGQLLLSRVDPFLELPEGADPERPPWETLLVDVESGEVLATFTERYAITSAAPVGSLTSRLLLPPHGPPELLDPESLQRRPLPLGGQRGGGS